jgi:hypothetical protein
MAIFEIEYHCHGYTLADAFRSNPRWGRRIFTVDGDKIGVNDPEQIKALAIETAPVGYELHRVTANDGIQRAGTAPLE